MASLPLKDQIQKIGITYESIVLILVPAAQTIVLLYKNEVQSLDMSKKTFLFFSFGVAAFNFAVHVFISFLKQKHRALILSKVTRIVSWILTIINIIENQLIDFDEEDSKDSTIKYLMLCYSIMGFFAFVIMQLLSISGKTLKIALISCSLLYFALRISITQTDSILAVFAGLLCLIIIRFFILTHRLKSKKNDMPNEQQSIESMLLKLLLSSTEDGFVIIDDKKSVYYANQKSYDMLDVNYGGIIAGLENMKRFEALSHEDQLNLREEILEAATTKNEPPKSPDEKHSSFSMEFALKNKASSPRDPNNMSEQAFQEDQVAQSAGRPKFKTFFPTDAKLSQNKLVRKNSHASQTTSKFKPPFVKQRSKQYTEKGATALSFPKLRSFLRSLKSTQTEGSKTHIDGIGHENTHENQTTVIHIDENNDRKTQQSPLYKPKKNNTEKNEHEERLFKDGIPENLMDFLNQMKPENVTCIESILNSNQIMNLIATEPKTHILEDIGYLHYAESGPKIIEVRVRPLHVMQKPFLLIQLKDVLERESYLNAKHSDREKTDLLSSVTHELRTPLNCIITMLDMVEDCVTDDVREDFILPASQSAKLLLNLINDILDYSQSKAKTLKLTYSRFNFYKHLIDIVKLMQFQAKSKGLDLLLEFDENAPTEIYSEPNRIRQIIINLIGNALKFTMKGEITLKVQYTELGVYCISVIDTGVGIKPEDVKDLFRRFSKVGGTDHINQQGVGLGLSISNTLAKMLNPNGHGIRVSSAYGKGTTFSFEIQPQNSFNAPEEKPDFDLSSDEEDVRQVIDNINELKEQHNYAQTQKNKVLTKSKNSLCGRGLSLLSKIPSSAQNYSDKDMSAASIVYSPNTNTKFQFEISRKVSREYGKEYNVKSNSHVVAQSGNFKAEQSFFIQKTFQTSHFSEDHLINPQSSRRMKDIYENRTLIEINAEKDRILQDIARKLNEEFEDPYLLVVDDNAFNIVALKKILEGMKIKIDSAINGDVAMQKIMERRQDEHEKNYRLILMDCNMPIKDGYQTTREIREFERENGMERVPIIAVTASSSPRDMERCFESGMDDYLTKPISFDGLKDVIIKYLSEDDIFDDVD